MSELIERQAWLLRRAVGIVGIATPYHSLLALDHLEDAVEVEERPGLVPYFESRPDGGAFVGIPALPNENKAALLRWEEIGHWRWRSGLKPPPNADPADWQRVSLVRMRELDEEGWAARWTRAVILPADLALSLRSEADYYDAMEAAGFDSATMEQRLREVRQARLLHPRRPDPWSALNVYRLSWLEVWGGAWLAIRGEGESFYVPVDPRNREQQRLQVLYDLAAFSPLEFRLIYRRHRPQEQSAWMPWEDLERSGPRRRRSVC